MDDLISARRPDLRVVNKKKTTGRIVYFAVLADHWVKLKKSENSNKYLELARELENLETMKVTVIPIVVGTLGFNH